MPSIVERGCYRSRKLEDCNRRCSTNQLGLPSGKSFHGKNEEEEEDG